MANSGRRIHAQSMPRDGHARRFSTRVCGQALAVVSFGTAPTPQLLPLAVSTALALHAPEIQYIVGCRTARGHDRITLHWDGWPSEHWVSDDGGVNFTGEADKGQREPQGRAGKEYIMFDFKPGARNGAVCCSRNPFTTSCACYSG